MNAPEHPALGVGLHEGIPMERYIADPCIVPSLSGSIIHAMLTHSPRHAWFKHPRLNPKHKQEQRGDFDIGSAAHALLLERDPSKLAAIDPRDYPGQRGGIPKGWTNDAIKSARDLARGKGKIPLLLQDANVVQDMLAEAHEYVAGSELAGIFERGKPEQTMVWDEGPLWFRARPDWLTDDGILVHYKTTKRAAEPESFGRSMIVQMGYDTACMFYERGFEALRSERRVGSRSAFLIQETEAPYCCSLIGLDPEMMDLASRKVERAIQLWGHCMRTGKWPGYPNRICYLSPKPWQVADFEEQELTRPVGQIDARQYENGGFAQV